jgi:hypothetical protein
MLLVIVQAVNMQPSSKMGFPRVFQLLLEAEEM